MELSVNSREPFDRNRVEATARELEGEAFRFAVALVRDPVRAEEVVLEAFGRLTPSLSGSVSMAELRVRLASLVRKAALPSRWRSPRRVGREAPRETTDDHRPAAPVLTVPEALHLRIVDSIEEQQNTEPIDRRRTIVLVALGVVFVAALATFQVIRSNALAAAQPTVTDRYPSARAKEVPLDGDFLVVFGRRPLGIPTLRLEPATSVFGGARWDGETLSVTYAGLHRGTSYQLILDSSYRSRFNDIGHLEQRWSFTAEGYPVAVSLTPTEGETLVARSGQVSIDFNHRPPVDPMVSITPADAMLQAGQWTGSTWSVEYAGLHPLTLYQATVVVDYGVRSANINRQWTFTTEPGPPPEGTTVLWYETSPPYKWTGDAQRMLAVDWDGNLVGTSYGKPAVQQSPDGSALIAPDGSFFDRTGTQIRSPAGYGLSVLFGDDGRSVCTLPYGLTGEAQTLYVGPTSGVLRPVGAAGAVGARGGLGLIACSTLNDRAVIAETAMGGVASVRVFSISTGRIIFERSYANIVGGIVSARDGSYLAEPTATVDNQGTSTSPATIIRRVADGQVVARLENRRVIAFSWDGRRVVTAPILGRTGSNEIDLVEWQAMKVLWKMPGDVGANGSEAVYAMAQPFGGEMVISSPISSGEAEGLWAVGADGSAKIIAFGPLYPAFMAGF